MLRFIKTLHTAIWLVFAVAIVALPALAWAGWQRAAWAIVAAVVLEGLVVAANRGRCPLTPWAEKHTEDRAPNFDIYLPVWLARWNKQVFTTIFVVGLAVTLWRSFAA